MYDDAQNVDGQPLIAPPDNAVEHTYEWTWVPDYVGEFPVAIRVKAPTSFGAQEVSAKVNTAASGAVSRTNLNLYAFINTIYNIETDYHGTNEVAADAAGYPVGTTVPESFPASSKTMQIVIGNYWNNKVSARVGMNLIGYTYYRSNNNTGSGTSTVAASENKVTDVYGENVLP